MTTVKRQHRRNFYYTIAAVAIVIGILGSLSAWEGGSVSLWQMLFQVGLSTAVAERCIVHAKAKIRTRRRPAPAQEANPLPRVA